MNTTYLDTMPEVKNKFKAPLLPGEKVVFSAKLWGISTDSDALLGADESTLTLTNRRIIANNGAGLWITDIENDVVSMEHQETGKFLSKEIFVFVQLNKEVTYGMGIQKLTGYKFHLGKKDIKTFDAILSNMKQATE